MSKTINMCMPQITEDRTIPFGADLELLSEILSELKSLGRSYGLTQFTEKIGAYNNRIHQCQSNGKLDDISDGEATDGGISRDFIIEIEDRIKSKVDQSHWMRRIGAGSGIAALTLYTLGQERATDFELAIPRFAGNLVKTAYETIQTNDRNALEIFGSEPTAHRPVTISLEHEYGKLMIPFSEGRTLEEALEGPYYERVRQIALEAEQGTVINCNSGLNKGAPDIFKEVNDETRRIIKDAGCRYKQFVCTNAFEPVSTKEYYEKVIAGANIVSYNELEAAAIYQAMFGKQVNGARLADVAKAISADNQVVVIHAAEGAVAYIDNNPGDFNTALEMAVGGSSLRCVDGEHHTEQEIVDFLRKSEYRPNRGGFSTRFGYSVRSLPSDIIGVEAQKFSEGMKLNNTGAGATMGAIFVGYQGEHQTLPNEKPDFHVTLRGDDVHFDYFRFSQQGEDDDSSASGRFGREAYFAGIEELRKKGQCSIEGDGCRLDLKKQGQRMHVDFRTQSSTITVSNSPATIDYWAMKK
ncbi:MAG: hypothetical protein U9O94_02025 [Nanoarchaeota archaeon]|nr:hypothetical protein [Nanoarchaeota archaeon]